jgi:ferredoxin--NADP+ reductase
MRLNDYDTTTRFEGTVMSSELLTPPQASDEVRELVFEIENGPDLEAGQSIGIVAPGDVAFGKQEHLRLYTVAEVPERTSRGSRVKIAVKRVSYIDEFSGERYHGIASNYLCDLDAGERIIATGPFGSPFPLPEEDDANLILIGMGTGIAPFRAFVRRLYSQRPHFAGAVRLFYGARSGLDLIYMNDERDDFTQYYDRETFEAFKAVSPRPHWEDPVDWESAIETRAQEIWNMLLDHKTYVYIAGLEVLREQLHKVFAKIAESPEKWERRQAELEAGGRWVELLY